MPSLIRLSFSEDSFVSTYKLSNGDVLKAQSESLLPLMMNCIQQLDIDKR